MARILLPALLALLFPAVALAQVCAGPVGVGGYRNPTGVNVRGTSGSFGWRGTCLPSPHARPDYYSRGIGGVSYIYRASSYYPSWCFSSRSSLSISPPDYLGRPRAADRLRAKRLAREQDRESAAEISAAGSPLLPADGPERAFLARPAALVSALGMQGQEQDIGLLKDACAAAPTNLALRARLALEACAAGKWRLAEVSIAAAGGPEAAASRLEGDMAGAARVAGQLLAMLGDPDAGRDIMLFLAAAGAQEPSPPAVAVSR